MLKELDILFKVSAGFCTYGVVNLIKTLSMKREQDKVRERVCFLGLPIDLILFSEIRCE